MVHVRIQRDAQENLSRGVRGSSREGDGDLAGGGKVGHELGVLGLKDGQLELLLAAGLLQLVVILPQAHVHGALACPPRHTTSAPCRQSTPTLLGPGESCQEICSVTHSRPKRGFCQQRGLTGRGVHAVGLHVAAAGLRENDIVPEIPDLRQYVRQHIQFTIEISAVRDTSGVHTLSHNKYAGENAAAQICWSISTAQLEAYSRHGLHQKP